MIPHSKPFVGRKEAAAVRRVIASGQLAQCGEVERLETELCAFTGHRYGLAVSSGTTALYGALKALGVGAGDAVIIPSYACTALANAVCMCGARPAACDVEYENGLMSVDTVKAALVKRTRAVIVPHLFGCTAPAHHIERELGIPVVEDCAQCIGTTIDGRRVGSLTSIAIFSFYATKVMCAGEGGLIAASDRKLGLRLENIRDYDNRDTWAPTINGKCSDVHAALARVQLGRLPSFIRRRRAIARRYMAALPDSRYASAFPDAITAQRSIYFRFLLRTSRRQRTAVMRHFIDRGISCARPIYKPFHRYLKLRGFPITQRLYEELVSLPIYPALTDDECAAIERAVGKLDKIKIFT
jgi:perosamine synthetase